MHKVEGLVIETDVQDGMPPLPKTGLISTTAPAAQLRREGSTNVLDATCEDDDLFLFRLPSGSYELLAVHGESCESLDRVGHWLFDGGNGAASYTPDDLGHPLYGVYLEPDDWGQLEAMKKGWSPEEWLLRLKAHILDVLGVPALDDNSMQAWSANGRLALLGLRNAERLARVDIATRMLREEIRNDEACSLASLCGSGMKEVRGHAKNHLNVLHVALYLLTELNHGSPAYLPATQPDRVETRAQTELMMHQLVASQKEGQGG